MLPGSRSAFHTDSSGCATEPVQPKRTTTISRRTVAIVLLLVPRCRGPLTFWQSEAGGIGTASPENVPPLLVFRGDCPTSGPDSHGHQMCTRPPVGVLHERVVAYARSQGRSHAEPFLDDRSRLALDGGAAAGR